EMRNRLGDLIVEVGSWCSSRRLQRNQSKTELAWFGKPSRLDRLRHQNITVTIGSVTIQPSAVVRDLGVLLDSELSMKKHVAKVTSTCFYQLRRLRQIRRLVGQELKAQLVHVFVLSRLDYGNLPDCRSRPSNRSRAYKTPQPASSSSSECETM